MTPMFHTARRRVHPSLVFTAATVVLFTVAMLLGMFAPSAA